MTRRPLLTILILALIGAMAGWLAAPSLSRNHYLVQVAQRIYLEESLGIKERTLQSTAFRNTGIPTQQLYADAHAVQRRFRIGGTLFGLWCGLVIAFASVRVYSERRRHDYAPDPAHCVSCARCYMACPFERQRLKEMMNAE